MLPRIVSGLVALLLAGAMVAGCSGRSAPEPSAPSAPAFGSDDEAFAAAEETYRAYVDALNQVDLSDPATFEPVFAWTTGEAKATEHKSLSQMHADGWNVSGETAILKWVPEEHQASALGAVVAIACTDISTIALVDGAGTSVVSPDRPDRNALRLTFDVAPKSATGLSLAKSVRIEDAACAD